MITIRRIPASSDSLSSHNSIAYGVIAIPFTANRLPTALTLILGLLSAISTSAAAASVLPRFPDAGPNGIVFVARDILWTMPPAGGLATRLAGGSGRIMLPRVSPDGRWVAYTLIHGATADVELVPSKGGISRRLTFTSTEGLSRGAPDNMVMGWTPDSAQVLFLSRRWSWNGWVERPFAVQVSGGEPRPLPLNRAGFLDSSPDGKRIVATRALRDFVPWKRYVGGEAQGLEVVELRNGATRRLPGCADGDTAPMWLGNRIYVLSDRDHLHRSNIWSIDFSTGSAREVTHFTDGDVSFPARGAGGITFEQGGRLWRMSPESGPPVPVPVVLPDDGSEPGPHIVDVSHFIRTVQDGQYPSLEPHADFSLSPTGKMVAVSARGRIVTWPLGGANGSAQDLTGTVAADEDHPEFSPDGRFIAYTTDRDGEWQLAVRSASGGAEQRLTHFHNGYLYQPIWSPNGRFLAVPDANHHLWLVQRDNGTVSQVGNDLDQEIRDLAFSPDGRWLVFGSFDAQGLGSLHLVDVKRGRQVAPLTGLDDARMPSFAADGRLVFASRREGVELRSTSDGDLATAAPDGIYAARLGDQGAVRDLERLPALAAQIAELKVSGSEVMYSALPPQTLEGGMPGERAQLHALGLQTGRDRILPIAAGPFVLSSDGQVLLSRVGRDWKRIGLGETIPVASTVQLPNVALKVDPRTEWQEMFEETWRLTRDQFADPKLNGVDWQAVHDRYAALLPKLGSRDDLNALLTGMLGEVGASHFRVAGGDEGPPPAPVREAAGLGADLVADPLTGRYRFARIYRGDLRPDDRAPLGLETDVIEGDALLAVDGKELYTSEGLDEVLAKTTGPALELTVSRGSTGLRHDVAVLPTDDEGGLRQADWIATRRALTHKLSEGQVGYIYLTDMGEAGAEQFARQFQSAPTKSGLVIDVRFNRGGYLSPMLIEDLMRHRYGDFVNREGGREGRPVQVVAGPKAVLVNGYSVSDAENFAQMFKQTKLGVLVGTRTMGGVLGVAGAWHLLDGGIVAIPFSQLMDDRDHRMIEGRGVIPDIVVDDLGARVDADQDPQLSTAISNILHKLARRAEEGLRQRSAASTWTK